MKKQKNFIYVLYFLAMLSGTIYNSQDPSRINAPYDYLSTHVLKKDIPDEIAMNNLKHFLHEHRAFVATHERVAQPYASDQTLAHFCANSRKLPLLQILADHDETADQPLKHVWPGYEKCLGSTAFLNLCFQISNIDQEQYELYLHLLNLFAVRTPAVVITSRSDGMTPAMAIASSKPANLKSGKNKVDFEIKYRALRILSEHNQAAFDGSTHRKNPLTVVNCLLQNRDPQEVAQSIALTLNHVKSRKLPEHFQGYLNSLIAYAHRYHNDSRYKAMLASNFDVHLPIITHQLSLSGNSCFSSTGQCLCCMRACGCCATPNLNSEHTRFWYDFYNKNPQHPAASSWLKEHERLVDNA